MLRRDGYLMLFAVVLFWVFIFNRTLSKVEGLIFLLLYIAYILFLFEETTRKGPKAEFKTFLEYFVRFRYLASIQSRFFGSKVIKKKHSSPIGSWIANITMLVLGIIAIYLGANLFVDSAVFFADYFRVPKTLIGLTIVSIGTTLPELSVTIVAARQGYGHLVMGNLLGSNIVNIFLILGVASVINPLSILAFTVQFAVPYLIGFSLLVLVFIRREWKIHRGDGVILLGLYLLFIILSFILIQ